MPKKETKLGAVLIIASIALVLMCPVGAWELLAVPLSLLMFLGGLGAVLGVA
jgi:cytosine/uracil/thiamine/allantoin permease